MAIDKPMDPIFNQDDFNMGPQGFMVAEEEMSSDEPMLTETEDGGMLVDFDPEGLSSGTDDSSFESNLAEYVEESELNSVGLDLIAKFNSDKSSRGDWEQTYEEGLDYLGLEIEDRTTPWAGACGPNHSGDHACTGSGQNTDLGQVYPRKGQAGEKSSGVSQLPASGGYDGVPLRNREVAVQPPTRGFGIP